MKNNTQLIENNNFKLIMMSNLMNSGPTFTKLMVWYRTINSKIFERDDKIVLRKIKIIPFTAKFI